MQDADIAPSQSASQVSTQVQSFLRYQLLELILFLRYQLLENCLLLESEKTKTSLLLMFGTIFQN
jgi:hypothetical protein